MSDRFFFYAASGELWQRGGLYKLLSVYADTGSHDSLSENDRGNEPI